MFRRCFHKHNQRLRKIIVSIGILITINMLNTLRANIIINGDFIDTQKMRGNSLKTPNRSLPLADRHYLRKYKALCHILKRKIPKYLSNDRETYMKRLLLNSNITRTEFIRGLPLNLNNSGGRKIHENVTGEYSDNLCPCIPRETQFLNTDTLFRYQNATWQQLEELHSHVTLGGSWKPSCVARQRLAIIIPYRDRERHLKAFLGTIHSILQSQNADYRIFVIEQRSPDIFNRASLMNIGYLEAKRHGHFGCYIFHDVDLLPETNLNIYSCSFSPLHIGAYMNKWKYKMPYPEFFGGAMAMTGEHINKINGFPNRFYGWGGEDDDIYDRILEANLTIHRHSQYIGRTYMIRHDRDKLNPVNPKRFQDIEYIDKSDGLNSTKYTTRSMKLHKLFTLVETHIERNYNPECIVNASLAPSDDGNYVNCIEENNFKNWKLDCCRGYHNNVYCCNKTRGYKAPGTYRVPVTENLDHKSGGHMTGVLFYTLLLLVLIVCLVTYKKRKQIRCPDVTDVCTVLPYISPMFTLPTSHQ